MESLRVKHFNLLPASVKDALKDLKAQMADEEAKKSRSVKDQYTIVRKFRYLKRLASLVILGFNSASYDIPVLLNNILELVGPEKIHVIKRGESVFALSFDDLSFRDAMNYCGPMSLEKFADIFKLDVKKNIFPYEMYESIEDMRSAKQWPEYKNFRSSLPGGGKDFISEINEILNLPIIYGLDNFGDFLKFIDIDLNLSDEELGFFYVPDLNAEKRKKLADGMPVSPKLFFEQKFEFENRMEIGEYKSFVDHLIFYNLLDCDLLEQAMLKFLEKFKICFDVCLFDRLSLPAISESIMWQYYDPNSPNMFSFNEKYGFLNKKIRDNLMGGPTIIFHRHAEVSF